MESRSVQLGFVLLAQSLVGSKDEYAVELLGMMLLGIIQILLDIDMQHQSLARTSGTPEGQFVQVIVGERLHLMPCLWSEVEVVNEETVDVLQQSCLVREVSVEVNLCEQQGQILVVFPCYLFPSVLVYLLGKSYNMMVIFQQFLILDTHFGIEMKFQSMEQPGYSFVIGSFQSRIF